MLEAYFRIEEFLKVVIKSSGLRDLRSKRNNKGRETILIEVFV